MIKTCFIMIGVSGAGKSTAVQKMCEKFSIAEGELNVFSLDECRYMLHPNKHLSAYSEVYKYACEHTADFNELVNNTWLEMLNSNKHLIVDNTNLTVKSRTRWIQDAKSRKFNIVAVRVLIPLYMAIERQSSRGDKSVPASVVTSMYMRLEEVQYKETNNINYILGY